MSELVPLKRLFSSVTGGAWGADEGEDEVDAQCIRGTDFDYGILGVNRDSAPTRSYSRRELHHRGLRAGDIVIEKSGGGEQQPVGRAVLFEGPGPAIPTNFAARLRPADQIDSRFACYLLASLYGSGRTFAAIKQTTGIQNLDLGSFLTTPVWRPPALHQATIADYLDAETARIDALVTAKQRMLGILEERADSMIRDLIGRSPLVGAEELDAAPIRRLLRKQERWTSDGEMVTAFRDGVVTTRAARGRDGFTNSWTEGSRVQTVEVGEVVVHGLDGFSGAIGDARRAGVCSPVYHVCSPIEGDGAFLGRILRLLALDGYLGNFAISTRERAVDFRNWDLFGRIPLPVVPRDVQRDIGDKIRAIRPIADKVLESEALAREHRQALITAAVTGELEIPGVAA